MSGSQRRKERRAAKRAARQNENPPPVLRLVRTEDEAVPAEQASPGCASSALDIVRETERSIRIDRAEAGGADVVAAASARGPSPVVEPRRSFDAAEVNAIFNDHSVYPLVAIPDMGPIDVTEHLKNENNFALMVPGGAIMFYWHDIGVYDVHTAFLKDFRGRHALRASLACYRWMFTRTDCIELLTKVAANNPAAAMFCRLVGATLEFERKAVWPTEDGMVDMSFWSLRYDDWVRQTPSLKESGRAFHARLEQEFERHGRPEEQHPDEDCHDLHVGACVEMIYGGQLEKAVILYNRWARFAGYGMIKLVSHKPAVVDIGNALLQVTGDTFKVLLVR